MVWSEMIDIEWFMGQMQTSDIGIVQNSRETVVERKKNWDLKQYWIVLNIFITICYEFILFRIYQAEELLYVDQ